MSDKIDRVFADNYHGETELYCAMRFLYHAIAQSAQLPGSEWHICATSTECDIKRFHTSWSNDIVIVCADSQEDRHRFGYYPVPVEPAE